jgi:hypothetical protein
MDRSGNCASAKTELGRSRIIVDAAYDFACVVYGSPYWADEQMVGEFNFRIQSAALKPYSSTVSQRSAKFSIWNVIIFGAWQPLQ